MITVRKAKRIAKNWVEAEAPNILSFHGVFLNGSILWKYDDEPLPPISDVDIKILVNIDNPESLSEQGLTQQYRSYKGIILETTFCTKHWTNWKKSVEITDIFHHPQIPFNGCLDVGWIKISRGNIPIIDAGELTFINQSLIIIERAHLAQKCNRDEDSCKIMPDLDTYIRLSSTSKLNVV